VRLFHGGVPGLRVGDSIEPSPPNVVDGCPVCEAKKRGESPLIDPTPAQPNRVYLTTDREYARFYASKWPKGDLYVVSPVGELIESEEDPFPAWTAEGAIVRSVYSRCVQLSWAERRSLLRRWPDPETGRLPTRMEVADMERGIAVGSRMLAQATAAARHQAHG